MAPDGACGVAQSTARSNAERSRAISKGISKEIPQETRKCCRIRALTQETLVRAPAPSANVGAAFASVAKHEKVCSSGDFEGQMASRHARAAISKGQWLRSTSER